MKKNVLIIMCLLCLTASGFAKTKKEVKNNLELPENLYVISTNVMDYNLVLTAIDLKNNELIIIQYRQSSSLAPYVLLNVNRTGTKVSPDDYKKN